MAEESAHSPTIGQLYGIRATPRPPGNRSTTGQPIDHRVTRLSPGDTNVRLGICGWGWYGVVMSEARFTERSYREDSQAVAATEVVA
jgi:hypothetical protein